MNVVLSDLTPYPSPLAERGRNYKTNLRNIIVDSGFRRVFEINSSNTEG